jgi:hypothetical protein
MDINASPVKAACKRYLQIGVKHQRHVLKRKHFDNRLLCDVPKESPVSSMNNVEWNELVQHWMDPKMKVSYFMQIEDGTLHAYGR